MGIGFRGYIPALQGTLWSGFKLLTHFLTSGPYVLDNWIFSHYCSFSSDSMISSGVTIKGVGRSKSLILIIPQKTVL